MENSYEHYPSHTVRSAKLVKKIIEHLETVQAKLEKNHSIKADIPENRLALFKELKDFVLAAPLPSDLPSGKIHNDINEILGDLDKLVRTEFNSQQTPNSITQFNNKSDALF